MNHLGKGLLCSLPLLIATGMKGSGGPRSA